jgi:ABC-type enterochelin transport system substrate-binding protein
MISMLLSGCGNNQTIDNNKDGSSVPASSEAQNKTDQSNSGTEEVGERLAKVYTDMMQSSKYYMKYRTTIEMDGKKETAEMEMAVNGDDSALISSMAHGKSHMVFKDEKSYLIDHQNQTVMVMNSAAMKDIKETDIDTTGLTYKGNGTGDFLGKKLPYEEYSTESGTIKYYFDGKKLVGIEVIEGEISSLMEVLEMSDRYPANMFTIPADYTKTEM